MHNIDISSLKTILACFDENSPLAEEQEKVIAIMEQLQNNSYTVYSRSFGNMSWRDECDILGIPHEAMEVKIGFLLKEVKIDTSDIAKRFCLDSALVRNYGDGRYYYCGLDKESNDVQIAHIEGDKLVYDIKPLFSIGETFELPCAYEDDGGAYTSIETYKITGYDLSGCFAKGIVYLGDGGSAWITENALIEQKAKFKVGDTFTTKFDYYQEDEIVTHTITKIDFSHEEADEIVYWDNNFVYCTESELLPSKRRIKRHECCSAYCRTAKA